MLDRSPPNILSEIILVDDSSDMPHLKLQLEDYVARFQKVKILRLKKREGLIRSRLLGAVASTAPVVTFLDSHCEPLLDRITRNSSTVASPIIDVISDDTFEYHYRDPSIVNIGGFDWNLRFTWRPLPERERKRRNNSWDPIRTPTIAGGIFAIDKTFVQKIGTYDSGFDIWGAENLELSFKTWMCGGTLEIVPCSHVGHVFRKWSPYSWRSGVNVLRRNSVRLAQVWMDDYAKHYYERIGFELGDFGDVDTRLNLRRHLKCQSFQSYLDKIYPEMFVPKHALASEELRNIGGRGLMCMDHPTDKAHFQ